MDKLTFEQGYGIATFPDKPIAPETLFYTASTTKSFTAAAVSLLIDDSVNSSETISWQVPLAKVIREDFVLADEYATVHATIEDALSHRTGMPRHDLSYGRPKMTVREVVENLRHLPMTAEIRTRFQYCNMMYIVISHFIESWTGMWLGDFLRTRIYEPLSMYSTFFSLSDAQKAAASGGPSLATPYYWTNKTRTYHSLPWLDAPQESGCGATISNVLDYVKWLRCMMTMSAPLSAAGHHALRSPRIISGPVTDEPTGFRGSEAYALGWSVSNYRGEVLMWHTGGLSGFSSVMMYFPRLQWGITMMANGGQGAAIQILLFKLIDDMLGIPEQARFDWAPLMELNETLELETLKNARNLLFPNAPEEKDSIPLSLPLESYAGVRLHLDHSFTPPYLLTREQIYQHESYPSITLTVNSSTSSHTASQPQATLHCLTQYEQYPFTLSFQHISGEHFMIYIRFFTAEARRAPDDYEIMTDGLSKAEFRLGEDGQVKELGALLEPEMGEAKVWFKKAGAENGDEYEKHFTAGSSAVRAENDQGASGAGGQRKLFSRSGRSLAPLFAYVIMSN